MGNEALSVAALLQPNPKTAADRKVWSIALQGVWIPFFTASNTKGESAIAPEVLGAPLRLQYEKDGTPKFSKNGRPVIRVAKELSDQIKLIRENFAFGLLSYAQGVKNAMPDEFQAHVEANVKAGEPVIRKDTGALAAYVAALKAKAEAAPAAEVPAAEATQPSQEMEAVPA